jgi:NADPH-dependent curcumin reductase CurA
MNDASTVVAAAGISQINTPNAKDIPQGFFLNILFTCMMALSLLFAIATSRITSIISNYIFVERNTATKELMRLVSSGRLRVAETITDGFSELPSALDDLLAERSLGSSVVDVDSFNVVVPI